MNKLMISAIVWVAMICFPLAAVAMDGHASHGQENAAETNHHSEVEHGDHGQTHTMQNKHAAMSSDDSMIIVGDFVSKGVRGMAHLKNISGTMAKMGMSQTHHFMIAFVDEATGEQIEAGTVALKITNPDAKVGKAIELVGMGGHFGADVVLDMKGEYHFKLGTKLADGKSRKYHFHQVIM